MRLRVNHVATTMLDAVRSGKLAGLAGGLLLAAGPVAAQMQLIPTPMGPQGGASPASPRAAQNEGARARAPLKPVAVKPPGEEAVLGRALALEGSKGAMRFDRADKADKDITVTKLTLPGERLSKPTEACEVDIVGQPPVVATAVGRPEGTLRWHVAVEACPFNVDVLDGAALVSSAQPSCDFVAADCRVNPVGLWGPPASAITPARVKELERERVQAETVMRANFRVLLQRAGKDRAAVKAIAGEQAAFSSQREMTCRDYARETVHGFCSAQITQARSLAIFSKLPGEAEAPRRRPAPGQARRPARGRPAAGTSAAAAPQAQASTHGQAPVQGQPPVEGQPPVQGQPSIEGQPSVEGKDQP